MRKAFTGSETSITTLVMYQKFVENYRGDVKRWPYLYRGYPPWSWKACFGRFKVR